MQEPGYMRAPRFATATFGLRLAPRLFEKTNNDVTTTASTVSNPLLHVRPPRAGRIACCRSTTKQKPVLVCEQPRAWVREKECSKIKLLLVVRVDMTHHRTGPTCLPLNLLKDPQYTIYLLQPLTFTHHKLKYMWPYASFWCRGWGTSPFPKKKITALIS